LEIVQFAEAILALVLPLIGIKLACFYGNLKIVRVLLNDSRVDPNASNNSIILANQNGHLVVD
jgi:hypothetical protein